MVTHKGASLVGLTVDIHGMEGLVQSLIEWPVLSAELLAHRRLKFMDPFLLHVTNDLDFRKPYKSDVLPSPGFVPSQQQLLSRA